MSRQPVTTKRVRSNWERRARAVALGAAAVCANGLSTKSLHAETPTTAACVKSYEQGQILRKQEDFLGARQEFLVCVAASCPAVIQADCTEWFPKVEEAIPLVVFEAKVNGETIFDVTVTMDGKQIANRVDGKSVEVNPGLHTFKFVRPGAATLEEKVIVRRGEKSRLILASWTVTTSVPIATSVPPPEAKVRPIPPLVYALGAASVVGFGTFAVLGITTTSEQSRLENSCAPNCARSEASTLETRYILADVAVGVGAASLIGAGIVWLTRPERAKKSAVVSTGFGVQPTNEGLFLSWKGAF